MDRLDDLVFATKVPSAYAWPMRPHRHAFGVLTLVGALALMVAAPASALAVRSAPGAGERAGRLTSSSRPDAWIKLCGSGDRCHHPARYRYIGNDVYNGSGASQTVSAGVEEQNDIRFWILFQNDGTAADTFSVRGCHGSGAFVVRAVLVGAHAQSENATNITSQFEQGTARFTFDPSSGPGKVVITLDIWARTGTEGVAYVCPVTVRSSTQPSLRDTVVAKMVTCLRNCTNVDPRRHPSREASGRSAAPFDRR